MSDLPYLGEHEPLPHGWCRHRIDDMTRDVLCPYSEGFAAGRAAPRAEGLDVSQLFDPLSDEVGRFVARWVKPEQRADAIEDAFRLLKLAREYPFDRDWAGPPYTRHARLDEGSATPDSRSDLSLSPVSATPDAPIEQLAGGSGLVSSAPRPTDPTVEVEAAATPDQGKGEPR